MTKLLNSDFRNEADMTELNKNGEDVKSGDQAKDFGIYMQKPIEGEDPECKWTYAFGNDYLDFKFPQYRDDQTITTWLLNLRNGLSEYTIESRGKQRWRNVTEEENIGRLNYRKDDYIDYLDGDLESSIYYNNTKRKEDINSGEMLGIYRGEALTPDQFTKRFKGVDNAPYVLALKNGTINVDGEKKGYNWVSRVNAPRGTTMKTNIWWDDDGNVFSKRKIKAGDELFVSYGPSYWRGFHRHQKNKTMKKKKHTK
jgi:hypothetical protein